MNSSLLRESHGAISLLRLDSPDHYPRLTRRVLRLLLEELHALEKDAVTRAVVLTGSNRAFAAGADLEEVSALDAVEALRFSALGQALMSRIEHFPKPVLAAIRGFCMGGGLDLALACHLRIASSDARFAHPGGSLGIITGWGGTARLPRIVGTSRAFELLASGRLLDAREAYEWKLVSRVVPPERLLETAMQTAERLAARAAV